MGWIVAGFLAFIIVCMCVSNSNRNTEHYESEDYEEVQYYSVPENRKIDIGINLSDKHFINKHLHRNDEKHERHKRNQWPL